jgi:hypothetical protein
MRSEKEFERLLESALTQKVEPDADIQRKVLAQWKEKRNMNQKKWSIAVAAAACVLVATVSVGATTHYLNSRDVAQELGYDKIAKVFEEQEAIEINETQSYGGYDVTLMGVASGESLNRTELAKDEIGDDKTYVVVALAKSDGTPMGTEEDPYEQDFFVSPLIEGLTPQQYNVVTMNGSYTETAVDGVIYRIVECDNVECFADHKMYLCVIDQMLYDSSAYHYDEESGAITVNEDYDGMNLLFDLPLDESKTDSKKAQEFIDHMEEVFSEDTEESGNATETGTDDAQQEYIEFVRNGSWKEDIKDGELLQTTTKSELNEYGSYEFPYQFVEGGLSGGGTLYFSDDESTFVDGVAVQEDSYTGDDSDTTIRIIAVAEKNEDGSATMKLYEEVGGSELIIE